MHVVYRHGDKHPQIVFHVCCTVVLCCHIYTNCTLVLCFQPTDVVDKEWVSAALKTIDRGSTSVGRRLSELRSQADAGREAVSEQVSSLRSVLTTHHNLMSDVRSILRTLAKVRRMEDCCSLHTP